MKPNLDEKMVAALSKVASYSQQARDIASRYLSSESSTDDIEMQTTLAEIQELARKHKFNIPESSEDKDALIQSLLKFIIVLEQEQSSSVEDIVDMENFDEDTDLDMFDQQEAEDDLVIATVEQQFKNYLLGEKFSNVMHLYSNKAMWETIQPQYKRKIATLLIDEALSNRMDNYPEFWNDFVK